jgi:glycosyltransferase involved in cell wall biosynthesis
MKFSVVIPTRNRLEYLKSAIFSVLCQDYDDWELIISDNASSEDVRDYVFSLHEPRVKYSRSDEFISVTKNWNRAIDLSTGDYVILIGDDDCLMQNVFSILNKIIKENSLPELIFANGLMYIYPGVFPHFPFGHLTTIGNWNLWDSEEPITLTTEQMRKFASATMNFRLLFSYNIQVLTMHKNLIKRLKYNNQFFHSPYPDFYAMTVLMQKVTTAIRCPYPSVIVGMSPKSYGRQIFNNNEKKGIDELHVEEESKEYPELDEMILPGTHFNTSWLYALRSVQKNLSSNLTCEINFKRYRELQLFESLQIMSRSPLNFIFLFELYKRMSLLETLKFTQRLLKLCLFGLLKKLFRIGGFQSKLDELRMKLEIRSGHINYKFKNKYNSILDVFHKITPLECKKYFENFRS